MRLFRVFVAALLIHGAALGQDVVDVVVAQLHDQINQSVKVEVGASIFDGYVISNDEVSANFRSLVRQNFQTSENAVVVTQKKPDGDITISLMPETAEKIVREIEPYIMLAERGRQVDETIEINPDITIRFQAGEHVSLSITLVPNNDTVTFRDADAFAFALGFSNATVDAKGWYIKEFLRLMMASNLEGK